MRNKLHVRIIVSNFFAHPLLSRKYLAGMGDRDVGTSSKKNARCVFYNYNNGCQYSSIASSLVLMLIKIMFPINSFYRRTGGFKLHRLRFFYESNCKIIEKLILDKTQKITSKTTRKLKIPSLIMLQFW